MSRMSIVLIGLLFFMPSPVVGQATSTSQPTVGVPGAVASQAPRRDPDQPANGTATVRGHVVAADSGQPLRRARVRIFSNEIRVGRVATTDEGGRYEFTELPAGGYTLSADKGSYVGLSFGQTRPFEAGKPLAIIDGQTIERVDFALPRGGVITGRIVDELGDPAEEAQVAVLRAQTTGGQRRLTLAGPTALSNDLGEFRLFGLAPGQYYLSATASNRVVNAPPPDTVDRSGYATTYFPGTANAAEAQRVSIGIGQTISQVIVVLVPTRKARVAGTVVDSHGRPMSGQVRIIPRGENLTVFGFGGGPIRPDGSFTVDGVTPGTYTLQASAAEESANADITVTGDLDDVHLVGTAPVSASGRLVVDAAAAPSLSTRAIRVLATPTATDGISFFGPTGPLPVNDDLTFELKTLPGRMRLTVLGLGPEWRVRAVRYRGSDVTDSGIDFKPDERLSDVEIELTNKLTSVTGLVTNGRDQKVMEYSVLVFPQDRDQWARASRYIQSGRPDQDGRFKVSGLPPGDYCVIALDGLDGSDASDPDFLQSVGPKATRFSLQEGETKTLDLRLNSPG